MRSRLHLVTLGLLFSAQTFLHAQNPADICGTVFIDENGNGIFDSGESSVGAKYQVNLFHFFYDDISRGNPCATRAQAILTDANGRYCFTVADDDLQYFMNDNEPCLIDSLPTTYQVVDEQGNPASRAQAPATRNLALFRAPSASVNAFAPEGTRVRLWVDQNNDGQVDTVQSEVVITSQFGTSLELPFLNRAYNLQFIPSTGRSIVKTESHTDAGPGGFTENFSPVTYQDSFSYTAVLNDVSKKFVSLTAFVDVNGNGIREPREATFTGLRVEAYERVNGSGVKRGTENIGTNESRASFRLAQRSPHYLKVYAPPGFVFSPQDATLDEERDSDFRQDGRTDDFVLTQDASLQCGLVPLENAVGAENRTLSAFLVQITESNVDLYYGFLGQPPIFDQDFSTNLFYQNAGSVTKLVDLRGNQIFDTDGGFQGSATTEVIGNLVRLTFPRSILTNLVDIEKYVVGYSGAIYSNNGGAIYNITPTPDTALSYAEREYSGNDVLQFSDSRGPDTSFDVQSVRVITSNNGGRILFEGYEGDEDFNIIDDSYLFFDSDLDANTGFRAYQVGADWMIRNGISYEYAGENGQWKWKRVGGSLTKRGYLWNEVSFNLPDASSFGFVMYKKTSAGTEFSPDSGIGLVNRPIQVNPDAKIIDGDFSDWSADETYDDSTTDHLNAKYNAEKIYTRFADGRLYLGYRNQTNVTIDDNWYVFIDPRPARSSSFTGMRVTTDKPWLGWRFGENLGATLMIKGRRLFRYTGPAGTTVWSWEDLGEIDDFVVNGKNIELAIDLDPPFFNGVVQFYGVNPQGGSEVIPDSYAGVSVRQF